jgi:ankyrin repeat protein/formylglycine-generating enzyme required for sulfatase activity
MKTIIVSLLASCVVSLAQTNPHNTDSRQLFNAATTNDVETVKVLLNKGVNINAKDTNGATALIKAASRGYADMTRLLLDKGAEINVKADDGWTALMGAAGGGSADITKLLLDNGADINAKADDGITALMIAAGKGHADTVNLLLDKGAEINAKDTKGATALLFAAEEGQIDTVRLLLDKGADVNARDNDDLTALLSAIVTDKTNLVNLLLDKGADITVKYNNGLTALMVAVTGDKTNMVNILLDKGADITVKSGRTGITALMFAIAGDKTNMVNILLDRGADINAKSNDGWTALMYAAEKGQTKAVKILLNKGADINVIDTNGITALMIAAVGGHVEVVKLLSSWRAGSMNAAFAAEKPSSFARTNIDSSGYVTNANLLTPFTVTNSAGVVFTNAVLVKLMPNKFIYKTPGGAMGTLRLDSLPEDLLQKIGYDPQVAQAADEAENQKKARQQQYDQQQRELAILAQLSIAPAGMALIPAGAFTMGDSLDGDHSALPLHTVYVSAFYMDVNLVSLNQWQLVYNWATNHGFGFVHAGAGKAANHPVQRVDWYDTVKWSNARSQQAGLTPVYYTDAGLTQVYTNGEVTPYVNWTAKGYRLPTEAEWEKAARGGASGQRFPWGDTISWSQANYYASPSSYTNDVNPTSGSHPAFNDAVYPSTSPVGYFAANGYGLYDMAGNVFQWCWDWYGSYSSASQTNPRGPTSQDQYGSSRVYRGGFWGTGAFGCRTAGRYNGYYGIDYHDGYGFIGFRSVLPPGQ